MLLHESIVLLGRFCQRFSAQKRNFYSRLIVQRRAPGISLKNDVKSNEEGEHDRCENENAAEILEDVGVFLAQLFGCRGIRLVLFFPFW